MAANGQPPLLPPHQTNCVTQTEVSINVQQDKPSILLAGLDPRLGLEQLILLAAKVPLPSPKVTMANIFVLNTDYVIQQTRLTKRLNMLTAVRSQLKTYAINW